MGAGWRPPSSWGSDLALFRRIWPFAAANSRGGDHKRQDIVILVTPYLWQPGTSLPGISAPPG